MDIPASSLPPPPLPSSSSTTSISSLSPLARLAHVLSPVPVSRRWTLRLCSRSLSGAIVRTVDEFRYPHAPSQQRTRGGNSKVNQRLGSVSAGLLHSSANGSNNSPSSIAGRRSVKPFRCVCAYFIVFVQYDRQTLLPLYHTGIKNSLIHFPRS